VVSGGAEVDFEQERFVVTNAASDLLPWKAGLTDPIIQSNAVTAQTAKPLFLAVGIEFYQEVNGAMYPLKNGAYNALAIVEVSGQ